MQTPETVHIQTISQRMQKGTSGMRLELIDTSEIKAGTNRREKIVKGLLESDIVLVELYNTKLYE